MLGFWLGVPDFMDIIAEDHRFRPMGSDPILKGIEYWTMMEWPTNINIIKPWYS